MRNAAAAGPVTCKVCRSEMPSRARKCTACHEWIADTPLSPVDQALRICGFVWLALSVLGAFVRRALGVAASVTGALLLSIASILRAI